MKTKPVKFKDIEIGQEFVNGFYSFKKISEWEAEVTSINLAVGYGEKMRFNQMQDVIRKEDTNGTSSR